MDSRQRQRCIRDRYAATVPSYPVSIIGQEPECIRRHFADSLKVVAQRQDKVSHDSKECAVRADDHDCLIAWWVNAEQGSAPQKTQERDIQEHRGPGADLDQPDGAINAVLAELSW